MSAAVTEARRLALAALPLLVACGGTPLPDLLVVDGAGAKAWLQAQQGKPVVLNYWATWCGPCVAELPDFVAATADFRASGGVAATVAMELVVDGITVEAARQKVLAKARELGLPGPLLLCTEGDLIAAREALGVDLGALPQTFAYDRRGALVEHHEGRADRTQFAALATAAAQ